MQRNILYANKKSKFALRKLPKFLYRFLRRFAPRFCIGSLKLPQQNFADAQNDARGWCPHKLRRGDHWSSAFVLWHFSGGKTPPLRSLMLIFVGEGLPLPQFHILICGMIFCIKKGNSLRHFLAKMPPPSAEGGSAR